MALRVVVVSSGGLPVSEASNGIGIPVVLATNGFGVPVTIVSSGGFPVVGVGAVIILSNATLTENSAEGTAVGNLSVSGGTGTYTFTLTDSAGSRFKVAGTNGVNLQAGPTPSNYEASPSYSITVHADNGAGSVIDRVISITIINVPEITLNALTLNSSTISSGSPENTLVGALQSVTSGSTLSMIDTAGGRFKLSGSNVVAGATPTNYSSSTSHNITVRETHPDGSNSPRDSVIAISVTQVGGSAPMMRFNAASNSQLLAVLEDF